MVKPLEASLDTSDKLALRTAKTMAGEQPLNVDVPEVIAPDFDSQGFADGLKFTAQKLREAGMQPEEVDSPEFADVMAAAFRSYNTVGAILSDQSTFAEDNTPLTGDDLVKRLKEDNLTSVASHFRTVTSVEAYEATKADIERQTEDAKIMEAGGGVATTTATIIATLADVPTLLPLGTLAAVGKTAKTTAQAARQTSLAAAMDATVSETALHSVRELQTPEETAVALSSSVVLGAFAGGALHKLIGDKAAAAATKRLDEVRKDSDEGYPAARSAGAAQVDEYTKQRDLGVYKSERASSAGLFELAKLPSKIPGVGKFLRNPKMDMEDSAFQTARDIAQRLEGGKELRERNIASKEGDGVAEDVDKVLEIKDEHDGRFMDIIHHADKVFKRDKSLYADRADFNRQLAMAYVDTSAPSNPGIREIVDRFVEHDRLLVEDAKAAGVFTENLSVPGNADRHLPLVWDGQRVAADRDEFVEWYTRVELEGLEEEVAAATKAKKEIDEKRAAARKSRDEAKEAVKEKIADEKADSVKALQTTRKDLLAKYDKQTKADRTAIVDDYKQSKSKAKDDHKARVNEHRESAKIMRAGDITKEQRAKIKDDLDKAIRDSETARNKELRKLETAEKNDLSKFDKERTKERIKIADDQDAKIKQARDLAAAAKKEADEELNNELKAAFDELGIGDDVRKIITDPKKKTPQAREALAANRAEGVFKQVTGSNLRLSDHMIGNKMPSYRKARKTRIKHSDLMARGWARSDMFDIAEAHTRQLGTQSAFGKVFRKPTSKYNRETKKTEIGDEGDFDLSYNGGQRIQDELDEKIAKLESDSKIRQSKAKVFEKKFKSKLEDFTDAQKVEFENSIKAENAKIIEKLNADAVRQKDNVRMLYDFAIGNSDGWMERQGLTNVAEAAGAFNFMRLMGGVVVSSLTDVINPVISHGLKNYLRHGIAPMLRDFGAAYRNEDGFLRTVSRLRMQNVEWQQQSSLMLMTEDLNVLNKGSNRMNMMRNATRMFANASGITYWNSFFKQVSANTAHGRLVSDAITGWSELPKAERSYLNILGIDSDMLKRIRDQYEAQPGTKQIAGIPVADVDKWTDNAAAHAFSRALTREARSTIIQPSFTDKLALQHGAAGRLIWQFRQHMIANQMRLIGRNMQLAKIDDEGAKAANVAMGIVGLMALGFMVDQVKSALGNSFVFGGVDPDESSWEKMIREIEEQPGTVFYNSADRAGFLGPFMDLNNNLEKFGLPNLRGTLAHTFDDDATLQRGGRYHGRNRIETLLGPSAGALDDLLHAPTSLTNLVAGEGLTRGDFRRLKGLVPGGKIPFGPQQFGNWAEKHLADYNDWPDPK